MERSKATFARKHTGRQKSTRKNAPHLIIREMCKPKSTMSYHIIPVRKGHQQKSTKVNAGECVEK